MDGKLKYGSLDRSRFQCVAWAMLLLAGGLPDLRCACDARETSAASSEQRLSPPRIAESLSGCALELEVTLDIARDRRAVGVALGRSGALITDGSTRPPREGVVAGCTWAEGLFAVAAPLSAAEPVRLRDPSDCGLVPFPVALALVDDEPVAIDCGVGLDERFSCRVLAPYLEGFEHTLDVPSSWSEMPAQTSFASRGRTLFGAAASSRKLFAWVMRLGETPASGELATEMPPVAHRSLSIAPTSATEADVFIAEANRGFTRIRIDEHAVARGERVATQAPAPQPAPPLVQALGEGAEAAPGTTYVMAARDDGELVRVTGMDPNLPAGALAHARMGERWLIAWTEGMGADARVLTAMFDEQTLALDGEPTVLSGAHAEAGAAHVATSGDRVVVAFDERRDGVVWLRAAELRCRVP